MIESVCAKAMPITPVPWITPRGLLIRKFTEQLRGSHFWDSVETEGTLVTSDWKNSGIFPASTCVKWKCFQVSLQRLAPDWVLTLVLETSLATKPSDLVLNLEVVLRLGHWDWDIETGSWSLEPGLKNGDGLLCPSS